jgi:hypothetical protein
MTFNPKIEAGESNASLPLEENNRNKLRRSSSSLAGREVVHLPVDDRDTQQVKIKTTADEKLVREPEEKKQKIVKEDFKPICYPGYSSKLYCSYGDIVGAIASWGKVEAILMSSGGLNHVFIVSFNRPIKFSNFNKGLYADLSAGEGIFGTPFSFRGIYIYKDSSSLSNVILSNNRMAFDIECLSVGSFSVFDLNDACNLLPERFKQIKKNVGKDANASWDEIAKKISESDTAELLLDWIKISGQMILEKGLCKCIDGWTIECSVEEIIDNYINAEGDPSWQVIMKS